LQQPESVNGSFTKGTIEIHALYSWQVALLAVCLSRESFAISCFFFFFSIIPFSVFLYISIFSFLFSLLFLFVVLVLF
jgi:hypothetical protein